MVTQQIIHPHPNPAPVLSVPRILLMPKRPSLIMALLSISGVLASLSFPPGMMARLTPSRVPLWLHLIL
jgi:hypothetical protein